MSLGHYGLHWDGTLPALSSRPSTCSPTGPAWCSWTEQMAHQLGPKEAAGNQSKSLGNQNRKFRAVYHVMLNYVCSKTKIIQKDVQLSFTRQWHWSESNSLPRLALGVPPEWPLVKVNVQAMVTPSLPCTPRPPAGLWSPARPSPCSVPPAYYNMFQPGAEEHCWSPGGSVCSPSDLPAGWNQTPPKRPDNHLIIRNIRTSFELATK